MKQSQNTDFDDIYGPTDDAPEVISFSHSSLSLLFITLPTPFSSPFLVSAPHSTWSSVDQPLDNLYADLIPEDGTSTRDPTSPRAKDIKPSSSAIASATGGGAATAGGGRAESSLHVDTKPDVRPKINTSSTTNEVCPVPSASSSASLRTHAIKLNVLPLAPASASLPANPMTTSGATTAPSAHPGPPIQQSISSLSSTPASPHKPHHALHAGHHHSSNNGDVVMTNNTVSHPHHGVPSGALGPRKDNERGLCGLYIAELQWVPSPTHPSIKKTVILATKRYVKSRKIWASVFPIEISHSRSIKLMGNLKGLPPFFCKLAFLLPRCCFIYLCLSPSSGRGLELTYLSPFFFGVGRVAYMEFSNQPDAEIVKGWFDCNEIDGKKAQCNLSPPMNGTPFRNADKHGLGGNRLADDRDGRGRGGGYVGGMTGGPSGRGRGEDSMRRGMGRPGGPSGIGGGMGRGGMGHPGGMVGTGGGQGMNGMGGMGPMGSMNGMNGMGGMMGGMGMGPMGGGMMGMMPSGMGMMGMGGMGPMGSMNGINGMNGMMPMMMPMGARSPMPGSNGPSAGPNNGHFNPRFMPGVNHPMGSGPQPNLSGSGGGVGGANGGGNLEDGREKRRRTDY
ncbi:hypothetical protein VP01_26g9 [Puccinia sorghi]|uniref:Uncharacterized protein n=1 Tax=Puccinia sorghi TaxID=27349 RepID=A0A0L6V4C6_9BASI|nr:hypothetical protein VP01_26g9 [Puccinia sorghi]